MTDGINHIRVVNASDIGTHQDWNENHEMRADFDAEQFSFLNQRIENRTDFPAGPVEGQIIFRTDLNDLYTYDGTNWKASGKSYYYEIDDVDFTIYPGMTTILESITLPAGTYLILGGCNGSLFRENAGWAGLRIHLTKSNVEITGSERFIEEELGDFEDKNTALESNAITTTTGIEKIELRGQLTGDASEIYLHDASLSIIRVS